MSYFQPAVLELPLAFNEREYTATFIPNVYEGFYYLYIGNDDEQLVIGHRCSKPGVILTRNKEAIVLLCSNVRDLYNFKANLLTDDVPDAIGIDAVTKVVLPSLPEIED